jgi:hypothetical protein
LNTTHDSDAERLHRVPFAQFFFFTGLQYALALLAFRFIAPSAFAHEIRHPGMIVAWTVGFGLPLSLFEYLYHRYLLHSAVLPFLKAMHRSHSHHHGLTAVKAAVTPKEPDLLVPVANEYAVEEEHQEEDMMFPIYALSIFEALFAVTLGLPFKLMFPGQPVFFAIITSVTLYYGAYELWHAIMHLPYDHFWKPLMNHKRVGNTVRFVYGFHLMHHWRPTANLAVVGFWGYALWDHLFGTHHRPQRTPLVGAQVNYFDADMRRPRWPVAMLDKWQVKLYQWSRKVEDIAAKIFLGSRKAKR